MALIESTMMPLGTPAPAFTLPEPSSGKDYHMQDLLKVKGLLVMFICNHCPYVKHIDYGLQALGEDYANAEIGIVAINANDAENYPQDAPERMAEKQYPFPYLYDQTQQVAKAYGAVCTPEFFLFDGELRCVYRGQFDFSRPGNPFPVTGDHVRTAMDALLRGQPVTTEQHPSIGCNIKWRE